MIQVLHDQHRRIEELCDPGERPFEVGEKRRIVQSPFAQVIGVPLGQGQGVGDGQPVPVDLKVGGMTRNE